MTKRLETLRGFAAADVTDWTGLPANLTVAEAAAVFDFDVADQRRWRTGEPPELRNYLAAATSVYADGLRLWLDGKVIVALEGSQPVGEYGGFLTAPDFGPPDAQLSTVLGSLVLDGGERVYASRGLAVRMNPENGLLLGLVGFVATTVADYRARLRPFEEPVRRTGMCR